MRKINVSSFSIQVLSVLLLTCALNTTRVRAEPVAPADVFKASDGWGLVYANTPAGGQITGDKEILVKAVRKGGRIGVTWLSWHGELGGECRNVKADLDGRLDCEAEVWCKLAGTGAPDEHGHRVKVTSGGTTSSIVLARRNRETRIFAVAEGTSSIRWYHLGQTEQLTSRVSP